MENEFGFSIDNPINVVDIDGEQLYLDALITKDGDYIFYHRLGSIHNSNKDIIDIFEICTITNEWHTLYFNIYADEFSCIPPSGFLFEDFAELLLEIECSPEHIKKFDEEELINRTKIFKSEIHRALFIEMANNIGIVIGNMGEVRFPSALIQEHLNVAFLCKIANTSIEDISQYYRKEEKL
jgi:hypothetical protein